MKNAGEHLLKKLWQNSSKTFGALNNFIYAIYAFLCFLCFLQRFSCHFTGIFSEIFTQNCLKVFPAFIEFIDFH